MTSASCLHRREDASRPQRDDFACASNGTKPALPQGAIHHHD
ncbi:MAG: hypothetical protein ACTHOH_08565 [Lysobacteraceae bacterium]